jgi:drug efflux transport system ATP-binding protein
MEPIIRTHNLTKRWGDLTAVDHLNLEVSKGEIFGLVGPDGAGKTTTLRMFCGLVEASEGEATIAGFEVRRQAEAVRDRIGYMAQRFGLYLDLTVDENMAFYADLFGVDRAQRMRSVPELLRMTRMDEFRNRQAGRLSGGMKQKLALMCTLLHRPQILFLDEPTNGVDPVSRRDFWAILYQLVQSGITVFVTTSYLDEAERCNRVALMNHGRLIDCAPPDTLRHGLEKGCYEVVAGDPRAARELLRRSDGVLSVEFFGATLHLFLEPKQTSPQTLQRELEGAELGAASFRPIVPSLEDVFIAMERVQGAPASAR